MILYFYPCRLDYLPIAGAILKRRTRKWSEVNLKN